MPVSSLCRSINLSSVVQQASKRGCTHSGSTPHGAGASRHGRYGHGGIGLRADSSTPLEETPEIIIEDNVKDEVQHEPKKSVQKAQRGKPFSQGGSSREYQLKDCTTRLDSETVESEKKKTKKEDKPKSEITDNQKKKHDKPKSDITDKQNSMQQKEKQDKPKSDITDKQNSMKQKEKQDKPKSDITDKQNSMEQKEKQD